MDLKDQVKEQIDLLQKDDEPSDRFLFFQSIFKKFNSLELGEFNDLTEGEWLGLFIMVNDDKISLEEVKRRIALIDEFIIEKTPDDLEIFLTFIKTAMAKINDYKKNSPLSVITQIIKDRPNKSDNVKLLDLIVACHSENNEKALDQWIEMLGFKLEYTVGIDFLAKEQNQYNTKIVKKALKRGVKALKDAYHFTPLIQVLQSYQSDYLHELERNNKKKKVLRKQYEDLLEGLEKGTSFKEIKKEWTNFTPEIQIALIEEVLETQNAKEISLLQEEQSLEHHNLIYNLLINQDVHPSILMELEKENFEEEKLRDIVDLLSQAHFPLGSITNIEALKELLQSDKETITNLLAYFKTGAITIDFLNSHADILTTKKDNIKQVFALLQQENGTFTNSSYNPNLLYLDPEIIQERLNLAKRYGLTLGNNPDTFNLLGNEALFDLIDFAIERELPIGEIIKINGNPEELVKVKKRLLIAQNFGLDILTTEDEIRYSLISGNSFIVTANTLDEVIIDDTPFNQEDNLRNILTNYPRRSIVESEEIKALDETYLDAEKECYNFNSVRISRNKLLRNLTTLKEHSDIDNPNLIYQAALFNTILSQTEIDTLKQCLQPNEKRI